MDPAKAWFFTLFGLLYLPVFLLTLVFFLWSLFRRSRMRGMLLLVLLPSLFFFGRYFQFKGVEDAPEPTLKVVSYNVGLYAHSGDAAQRLALADSVSAFLARTEADIICLQEFWLGTGNVEAYLKAHFPGYQADYFVHSGRHGQSGNVILSRRPIVHKGKLDFENSNNLAVYADIRLDSATVRFYDCHFESYNISLSGVMQKLLHRDEVVEETGRKMRRSITQRPSQVAEVMADVDAAPFRSVVLGDFNDNPLSYTYFRLSRGRRDAFVTVGKGFGATFREWWPMLRIDHVLYPSDLEAVSYEVPKVNYSDHYPVIVSFYETRRNIR